MTAPETGADQIRTRARAIAELARTPALLSSLAERARAKAGPEALTRRPGADAFSLRENIHHFRDIDIEGFSVRLGRLLNEDRPDLPGVDGGRLAAERHYNEHPHEPALEEFSSERARCVRILENAEPSDWLREGTLEGTGAITLARLVELWVEHDRDHLAQVEHIVSL
jgi:hypothetical protein